MRSEKSEAGNDLSAFGYKQELKRELSALDLTIYGMLFMGLTGPMLVYVTVAQTGYGMVPLVYLVGVIAMTFTAFSYSRLSREFPIAGSVFSFVQRGVNPHVGFVFGWIITLGYILIPALAYILSSNWLHTLFPSVHAWVWIALFVVFNTTINIRGITLARWTNICLVVIQVIALTVFFIAAYRYVFVNGNGLGHLSIKPFYQPEHFTFGVIASSASVAVLSFLGFDAISTLAEETKNPEKSVGRATIASLILIGVLFVSQTYMAGLIHINYTDLDVNMGFFDIAREAGGDKVYYLLIFVNILSTAIAVTLSAQSALSRIIYSMSRDKLLPGSKYWVKIHPKFQTPVNAVLLVAVVSIVAAISIPLSIQIRLINFGALTSFMMLNLTVAIYFFFKKKKRGLKNVINYLVFPLAGFLVVAYVWSGFDTITYVLGSLWALIGVIIGYVKSNGYKNDISKSMEM